MKKVCFMLSFFPDQRVEKRIRMFDDYKKYLIYCNRNNKNENYKHYNVDVKKLDLELNSNLINRYFNNKKFDKFKGKNLSSFKDLDYIYTFSIDNLKEAVKYKKKNPKTKIIYEVADIHTLLIDKQKSIIKKTAQKMLLMLEKKSSKFVDKLVITSPKFYDIYFKNYYEKDKIIYIPNIPDTSIFEKFQKDTNHKFTIGFIGLIRYWPQIKSLLNSVKDLDVEIILAGQSLSTNVYNEIKEYSNVKYLGRYEYKDIVKIYSKIDCIYCSYDVSQKNVKYALPNKLYEAIYFEIPMIVSKNTYLSEIVESNKIGISVECNNVNEIKNAIKYLLNKKNYEKIILNFKNCKNLIDLKSYEDIFKEKITH